jgi:hypothetical protein
MVVVVVLMMVMMDDRQKAGWTFLVCVCVCVCVRAAVVAAVYPGPTLEFVKEILTELKQDSMGVLHDRKWQSGGVQAGYGHPTSAPSPITDHHGPPRTTPPSA